MYYLSTKFSPNFYEWIVGNVPVELHLDIDYKEEMFDGRTKRKLWITTSNRAWST
jgi:hypothetical protein